MHLPQRTRPMHPLPYPKQHSPEKDKLNICWSPELSLGQVSGISDIAGKTKKLEQTSERLRAQRDQGHVIQNPAKHNADRMNRAMCYTDRGPMRRRRFLAMRKAKNAVVAAKTFAFYKQRGVNEVLNPGSATEDHYHGLGDVDTTLDQQSRVSRLW